MTEVDIPTLPLLRGTITEQEALAADKDVIQALSYPTSRFDFFLFLLTNRRQIEEVVSMHLGIPQTACSLGEVKEWIHGSFNACLPVRISHRQMPERLLIRFPLPYKVGEAHCPGNVEEKLRCEAATYIWLQSNCPAVPIPRLFAFGLPGTRCFTHLETASCWSRIVWKLRQVGAWFSRQSLSPYVTSQRQSLQEVGYLIIEHVEAGRMLSESWDEFHHEPAQRANLFRGLARIQLELQRHPLSCIGSLTIDDHAILKLANRPLTLLLHDLENHGISTNVPRDQVYNSIEHYYLGLLECHDNRMRYQPNSIHDIQDGQRQLAALAGMRALLDKFTVRQRCGAPYILSLTDLHQSNIFVDDEWNITRIIDLEWACSRPAQMQNVPYWLTSQGLDCINNEALEDYQKMLDEFIRAAEEVEESEFVPEEPLSQTLRSNWSSGRFWFTQALDCPEALYAVFINHIQARFGGLRDFDDRFDETLARYWDRDAVGFISRKVAEHTEYEKRIHKMFVDATQSDIMPDA